MAKFILRRNNNNITGPAMPGYTKGENIKLLRVTHICLDSLLRDIGKSIEPDQTLQNAAIYQILPLI